MYWKNVSCSRYSVFRLHSERSTMVLSDVPFVCCQFNLALELQWEWKVVPVQIVPLTHLISSESCCCCLGCSCDDGFKMCQEKQTQCETNSFKIIHAQTSWPILSGQNIFSTLVFCNSVLRKRAFIWTWASSFDTLMCLFLNVYREQGNTLYIHMMKCNQALIYKHYIRYLNYLYTYTIYWNSLFALCVLF